MEKLLENIRSRNLVPWVLIFYVVGVAGMCIPLTRDLFQSMIPVFLLLNFILLLVYHGRFENGFLWKMLVIYLAGFLIELAGVNTGVVFGTYEYGGSLGPKLLHTPLIIGINWLMLVYCSLVITSGFIAHRYFRVIVAAIMMVVYDFALEPAAINFDMWNWGGPVPMQNYIAWLVISLVLLLFAERTNFISPKNKIASPLFFLQLGFFVALDVIMLILSIWE